MIDSSQVAVVFRQQSAGFLLPPVGGTVHGGPALVVDGVDWRPELYEVS